MSSTLQAILEDKRIEEIKSMTAAKDDGIPFLLLPVRIETRFMELDEPSQTTATDNIDAILDQLLIIQVDILDIEAASQAAAAINKSLLNLQQVSKLINEITNLTAKNKRILKEMAVNLQDTVNFTSQKFPAANFTSLKNAAAQLVQLIDALVVDPRGLLNPARDLLEQLKTISTGTAVLADRNKTPYQNVKNKKDLYNFVTEKLSAVKAFYDAQDEAVKTIHFITKNQFDSIVKFHTAIKNAVQNVTANLSSIHDDAAWASFVAEKVTPSIPAVQSGLKHFDDVSIPALKALPAPPQYDYNDLLLQTMKAFLNIKKFSPGSDSTAYTAVSKFKTQIKGSFGYIDKSVTAIQFNRASQLQRLKTVYDRLTPALSVAKEQLTAYSAKNSSQAYGISNLSKYITDDAKTIIDKATAVIEPQLKKVHELWVRIYPDDIFIHTHEEALTAKEFESGQRFWSAWWIASEDIDLEKAAWKRLCTAHGTKRASWIAATLDPRKTNIARNAEQLANKPYIKFSSLQELAKKIPASLQLLKPTEAPINFWTNVSAPNIKNVSVHIKNLLNGLEDFKSVPDAMMQKMQVQLLRAQGDIQAIISKTTVLTPAEQTQFKTKLEAFNDVVQLFSSLSDKINTIATITVEQAIAELPKPAFDYNEPVLKDNAWTVAPHTFVMPERFAVVTVKDGRFQHVAVSNKIPTDLQLGPNPAFFSNKDENGEAIYKIDENGDLVIEDGMKWMTEYRRAVESGMGVTLPLTEKQFNDGFDKLLVIGVKDGDANSSKALLEKLIINHVYAPDGMSILKVGTPTNNTETASAGYSARDNDEEERFEIEIKQQGFNPASGDILRQTDGKRLADGLGVDAAVIQKINNRLTTQVSNAFAMNRALWHATIGHSMEEMWDHVFNYDNIQRTENFFVNNCPARGVLPSLRIGVQPYGILPTTAYSRFKLSDKFDAYNLPPITKLKQESDKQLRFDLRLQEALRMLNTVWTSLRKTYVANYAQLEDGDPQQKFVEMLGLNASSVDQYYRYGVNITRKGIYSGPDAGSFDIRATHGSEYMRLWFKELMINGRFTPSFAFDDEIKPQQFDTPFKLEDAKYSRIRDQFEQSRIFRNRFIAGPHELRQLTGFMIDSKELSATDSIEKTENGTYIDWLLNSFMDTVLAGNDPEKFPSRSLLFLMLRQSLMQAYQVSALDILEMEGLLTEDTRRIVGDEDTYSEWGGMGKPRRYNTKWHLLLKDIDELKGFVFDKFNNANPFYNYLVTATANPGGSARSSMAVYINKPDSNTIFNGYANHVKHRQILKKVDAVKDAFAVLNTIPTEELAILLSEHIDLCSYRLDAWLTGLVNRRLYEQRATKKAIHLGAYGWVENLKRDSNKKEAKAEDVPEGLNTTGVKVYDDPDNDGFIHAPSLNHAIAAAVLRSAYKANYKEEDINNRLAVNISSSRVRMALNLIDGVKNGLQLGAILGFQFEKGIHERYKIAELDKFILPFRNAFPLVVPVKDNAQPGRQVSYNSNVVDGMALLNKIYDAVKWLDFPSDKTMYEVLTDTGNNTVLKWLHDLITDSGGGSTEYEQVAKEIDRMADALDALGDVAISESVYQIVQGNHVRAAAMVNSLAQGKNIPDPQIVDTPRSGTVVTQRVVLNFEPLTAFASPSGWSAAASARSKAEPTLNNWFGQIIGNPANIKCIVEKTPAGEAAINSELSLDELELQPIDFIFLSAGETDFKNYIAYLVRQKSLLPDDTIVKIDLKSRIEGWSSDIRTFYEMDHLLSQLRTVVLQAPFAGADHFVQTSAAPDANNPGNHDITQYKNRGDEALSLLVTATNTLVSDAVIKDLLDAKTKLEAPNDTFSEAQFKLLKNFLLAAMPYGIPNAVPTILFETAADLTAASQKYLTQTVTVYKIVNERIKQATDSISKINSATPGKQILSYYNDAMKFLFGKAFVSLPIYTASTQPAIAAQLNAADDSNILRHAGAMAMAEWLQSIARVRPKMTALELMDMVLSQQDAGLDIAPVQLNYRAGDYWLGAEFPAEFVADEDKLSIVLINPSLWQNTSAQKQAGMVIDEWMEVIPNKVETTGIVLNYDKPNAMPPQSLLLAVTPQITGSWKWEDLVFTLIDTLEMAKNRAVEPDHIDKSELSHILPGVLSEVAPPQTADIGDDNPLGVQVVMDFSFNQQPIVQP